MGTSSVAVQNEIFRLDFDKDVYTNGKVRSDIRCRFYNEVLVVSIPVNVEVGF